MGKNLEIERAAAAEIQAQEKDEQLTLGNIKDSRQEVSQQNTLGWKTIPLDTLPTQGIFYPIGTKIAIRAALVQEIRHWSTIDESDAGRLAIDDIMNYVIERCVQISIPGMRAYHKDLKEIDRFYLIFAIRELTFKDGENKLYTEIPKRDNSMQKIEVTKDVISYFKPDKKLMKFYSEEERCFVFKLKDELFKLHIPSIGITTFLKEYRMNKMQNGLQVDEDFERYCLFLFNDWRTLTRETFENEHQKSLNWSVKKISVLSQVVDLIKNSVNPTIVVNIESEGEVVVPLNFQGGLKAIFIIPDILDELE